MNPETRLLLAGARFGDVEYAPEDVIAFPEGLIGFPNATTFLLLAPKPDSPFRWLQSVEQGELAFLVTDPAIYIAEYAPDMPLEVARALDLDAETPRLVLTTVRIPPGRPEEMTLNLAGPLVINLNTRNGRQVVLEDEAYTTRHRVFPAVERTKNNVAA